MWNWLRKNCLASLICCCSLSAPLCAEEQDKIVLLLSHPSYKTFTSIIALVAHGKLALPNLCFLVLYHEKEAELFQGQREYVQKHDLRWIEFIALEQDVDNGQLFAKNAWSAQFATLYRRSDGIMFLGGSDIQPHIYGREKSALCEDTPTPRRHAYEASFLFHLLGGKQNADFTPLLHDNPHYPLMGICLGLQTMNVAAGGTLHQDIPHAVYGIHPQGEAIFKQTAAQHRNYHKFSRQEARRDNGILHPITVYANAPLSWADQETPLVSSSHHQAIEKLGSNLAVWAMSPDGKIIEGIRHTQFPRVFAVQFHPEKQALWERENSLLISPDSEETTAEIFLRHKASVLFHEQLWQLWATYLQEYHGEKKSHPSGK
jgi:putative glutamine amidotransferase